MLACGCEPEPEDNLQADRRCSTPCRRPAGQQHRGQCCWCRTAAGSCSSVSEGGKRINPVSIISFRVRYITKICLVPFLKCCGKIFQYILFAFPNAT